jgi:integrase/recombinase XerC
MRSRSALGGYLEEVRGFCESKGVGVVEDLTPDLLREFVLVRCEGRGEALVKAVVWSLRRLGSFLKLHGLVEHDPGAVLHYPKARPRRRLPKYLSAGEIRRVLEVSSQRARQDLVITALLVTAGLRPESVATLKRDDLSPGGCLIVPEVKGGWRQRIPLSPAMGLLLADYLGTLPPGRRALFTAPRGGPMNVKAIERMLLDVGQAAGLEVRLNPRLLRHTFGTHSADRHGRVTTRALLGHRRVSTTAVYTHLSPRRFKALMNLHPYQTVIPGGGHE